jgi:hypothetical protein
LSLLLLSDETSEVSGHYTSNPVGLELLFGGNEIIPVSGPSDLNLISIPEEKKKIMSSRSNRNKNHQTIHENELNPNKKFIKNKQRDLRKEDGEEVRRSKSHVKTI